MPVPRAAIQLVFTIAMEDVDEDPVVEVLFEYKGSRKALIFQVSAVCDRVEQELRKLGVNEPTVSLSAGLAKPGNENPNCFFLQKWCCKWGTFINVENVHEILSDDKLTVVRKPTSSPVKVFPMCGWGILHVCGSIDLLRQVVDSLQ